MDKKSKEISIIQRRKEIIQKMMHSIRKRKVEYMEELQEAKTDNNYFVSVFHNYEGFLNVEIIRKEDDKTSISNLLYPAPEYCNSVKRKISFSSFILEYGGFRFLIKVDKESSCLLVYNVIEKTLKHLGMIPEHSVTRLQSGTYVLPRKDQKMDTTHGTYTLHHSPGFQLKTKEMKTKEYDHRTFNQILQSKTITCDKLVLKLGRLVFSCPIRRRIE